MNVRIDQINKDIGLLEDAMRQDRVVKQHLEEEKQRILKEEDNIFKHGDVVASSVGWKCIILRVDGELRVSNNTNLCSAFDIESWRERSGYKRLYNIFEDKR